ncbi:MAG TPA: hypothetical protein VM370_06045 [Candidatus Thermoplasmatota archaeon]|nr:hypothetical protein [Candidatus Thermoplasmatota archaeon]
MATVSRAQPAWASLFRPGLALDWAFVAASAWILVGLHLDGWAHAHRPGLESFFTPWHGILYSGFFALAGVTLLTWVANGREMPAGYGLTGAGVLVFLAAGAGDMVWHTLFGIEANVEALLSPTHLGLATGMALMVAGPLRSAQRATLPALLAAGLLLSVFTFFTQFTQPGGRPWPFAGNEPTAATFPVADATPDFPVFAAGVPAHEVANILGLAGILLATILFLSFALFLLHRFALPFGALTLVFAVDGALLALMRDTPWWLAVALVAGLAADALARLLRPREGGWRLRAFAAAAPAALWSAYFAALALAGDVWWSVHLWTGAIVASALAGVALSYLMHTPRATPAPLAP